MDSWNCRFPTPVSHGMAAAAILSYWTTGLASVCLGDSFFPPAFWFFVYFAHYAAVGGLTASLLSKFVKTGRHAVLFGAIIGALLAGLLLC